MATSRKRPGPPSRTSAQSSKDHADRRARLAAQQQAALRARKRNRILTIAAAAVVAILLAVGITLQLRSPANQAAPAGSAVTSELTVRENSHRLSDPAGGRATFVEFLDFECEACGAAYPAIEQLRATYGDRVSFVVRYFPLDGHFNAMRAARAVEAAAQQGKFEAMYKKMYETQSQWGEQQVPKDDLFRQFAQELGLDLARWDVDYNSATTLARIQADIADGKELGVTGTPAFFVNGQRLQPKSINDLTTALDQALAS